MNWLAFRKAWFITSSVLIAIFIFGTWSAERNGSPSTPMNVVDIVVLVFLAGLLGCVGGAIAGYRQRTPKP
jgi:hypothetical protein